MAEFSFLPPSRHHRATRRLGPGMRPHDGTAGRLEPSAGGVTLLIDVSVGDTCRAPCRVARRERCQRSRRPGKRRWPRPTGVPRAGRYRGCSARWPLFTGPRASGPPAARMSVPGGSRDGQRGRDAVAVRVGCSDSPVRPDDPRASRPQASFSLVPSRGMSGGKAEKLPEIRMLRWVVRPLR